MRLVLLGLSHMVALAIGFGLGVYFLPILTAPSAPEAAMLESKAQGATFTAAFTRERRGSDFLHWGEGTISLGPTEIVHQGRLAPGPDYKLYLTTQYVEHEDEFEPIKAEAVYIGDVKTFDGLLLSVPEGVDVAAYNTVVIWCEAFSEFITSAQYQ